MSAHRSFLTQCTLRAWGPGLAECHEPKLQSAPFSPLLALNSTLSKFHWGFPGGSVVKNPPANAGDTGSNPGLGRSSGEGNGNPLQYSCLENPMDTEVWWATVHRVTCESDTTERLNNKEVSLEWTGDTQQSVFCTSYAASLIILPPGWTHCSLFDEWCWQ